MADDKPPSKPPAKRWDREPELLLGQEDVLLAAMQAGVDLPMVHGWIARGARFEDMAKFMGKQADLCLQLLLDSLEQHDWIMRAWIVYSLLRYAANKAGSPLDDAHVRKVVLAFDEAIEQRRKTKGVG